MTDGAYRTQLENESKVLFINAWHDYVRKEFDAIVEGEKKTTATVLPITSASSSKSTTASTLAPVLIFEPTLQLTESLKQSETVYRNFSLSVNKMWRADISSNIAKVVKDKLKKRCLGVGPIFLYIANDDYRFEAQQVCHSKRHINVGRGNV